jgi:hypothetical protein
MAAANSHNLPELFMPDDSRWASRAAARGEIRRLARGLYSTNSTSRPTNWCGGAGMTPPRCTSTTR